MNAIINYENGPKLITLFLGLILFGVFVYLFLQAKIQKEREERMLERLKIIDPNFKKDSSSKKKGFNPIEKWNNSWGKKLKSAGMIKETVPNRQIGFIIIFLTFAVYILLTLVLKNPGIGIIPALLVPGGASIMANQKISKRDKLFDEQIPAFLSSIKSNIQASETPERALLNAIKNTSDPLYSEVKIAKSLSETGNFMGALATLRNNTDNYTLQFLCSCMELSATLGANLEEQITIIEDMLETHQELQRKLNKAISENRPLLYVSAALIPAIFVFMYLSNEQTRDFWFKSTTSWVVFVAVLIIYGGAVFLVNRMINKTSKF